MLAVHTAPISIARTKDQDGFIHLSLPHLMQQHLQCMAGVFVDRRQHILCNAVSCIDPAISRAMGMAFGPYPLTFGKI